jgi:hypothetical protein
MAFLDLCRLCGTDTLNVVRNAIFEGEGRAKKYALKISECLTLQVCLLITRHCDSLRPPVLVTACIPHNCTADALGFGVFWSLWTGSRGDFSHLVVTLQDGCGHQLNCNDGPAPPKRSGNLIWLLCYLQVSEEDHLPKIMCGECSYKLDMLSDFKKSALKTEMELFSKVDVLKVKSEVNDLIM